MSDLIERRAAIEAVEYITSSMSVCVNTDECHGMKRMQRQAVIELTNLPSAQQWIPVSERLPEVGRNVLMSVGKGMYTAEGFLKGNGKWAQYRWSANLDNVDAWAEMPEPWKGEQL